MLVTDLIPITENHRLEAEEAVAKNKMFGSIDQFIAMYNGEILNVRTPIVSEMAIKLADSFKNLSIVNNKLVIETKSEVAARNSIVLLKNWEVVSKLKRLATTLIDESYDPDTKIVFSKTAPGRPLIEILDAEGEIKLVNHWSVGKITNSNADLANNLFTRNIVKTYDNEGLESYFNIEDLIDVDDTFLQEVETLIVSNTFKQ